MATLALPLLLLLLSPLGALAAPAFLRAAVAKSSSSYVTQEPFWFSQRLDHFASQDRRTFPQRYYHFQPYFHDPHAPIFLRICGEGTCSGISNDYLAVLARQFGAAIVCLEHRYYGESSPFEELTADNLKYLSSQQALFDLASFRNFYQNLVNKQFNRTTGEDNPWIVFGVSYPGALSAWFRLKFPHLVRGSLSSSGVVLAVHNYTAFDEQIAASAGPACASALREVTRQVDIELAKNPLKIKSLFGVEQFKNDGDFRYLLADAAAEAFQYGNPDILCLPLVAAHAPGQGQDVVAAYAEFVKTFFFGTFGVSPQSYDQEYLKLTKSGPDSGITSTYAQMCLEMVLIQKLTSQICVTAGLESELQTFSSRMALRILGGTRRSRGHHLGSLQSTFLVIIAGMGRICVVAHSRLFKLKGMRPSVLSPMKCTEPGNKLRTTFTCGSTTMTLPSPCEVSPHSGSRRTSSSELCLLLNSRHSIPIICRSGHWSLS